MKKIVFLKLLLLQTFLVFGQKDFPLNTATWSISSPWQSASKITLNPINEKKTQIIDGKSIIYSKTPNSSIVSGINLQDLKLKFYILQSKSGNAKLNLGDNLSLIFDMNSNTTFGAILKNNETIIKPLAEAKRKEGLWQKVELVMSLTGLNSIPVIEKVILNDLLIHSNVLLPNLKSTNGSLSFSNETGLLAFKDFEYIGFEKKQPISISNLSYTLEETYNSDRSFESKNQDKVSGKSKTLTTDIPNNFNKYILHYKGDMHVEKDALYGFTLEHQGTGKLLIDGEQVVGSAEYLYRNPISGLKEIKAGKHSFEYIYHPIYWRPVFGIEVSGADFRPYGLNDPKTLPTRQLDGGIFIDNVENKARTIRSFLNFNSAKLTKVISVGTPQKIHYSFDLDNGSLLQVWKGKFADVTQMWHERGEPQLLYPSGLITVLNDEIPFFELNNEAQTKPDIYTEFVNVGYDLDESGVPTYNYNWKNASFSQKFSPSNDGLLCEITSSETNKFGYTLAIGSEITKLSSQLYKVDNFYVEINEKAKIYVKENGGKYHLRTNLNGKIAYTLTW
ncbi:MAG TPA: hypothetical protein VK175_05745 [Leadbetterella sp.]|nr:hypothetical protein [Leadbetterella sp.]